jgi:vacuolar-type H+-ATPase subunit E/Vma4
MLEDMSKSRVKKIHDYIQEEINKQCSKIMLDAEEKAQEIISEALTNAKSLYLEKINEIKNEFDKIKNRNITEAEFNAKQKILKRKNDLIYSIFDDVLNKLKQYMATDTYLKFLEKSLTEVALNVRSGEVEIVLCDSDTITSENMIKSLEEKINHKFNINISFRVSQEKIKATGGFIARHADGKISYDYTFETMLDKIKEPLRPVISKILFE